MAPDFSIILPMFNERAVIPELVARLEPVMAEIGGSWEVLFVDDGSSDGGSEDVVALLEKHPAIRLVQLSRNFGHQAALHAGLTHSSGRAVIVMDSDLQDLPEALPAFVEKWREGHEVVYAVRLSRKEGWARRRMTALFYRLQSRLTRLTIPLDAGNFSLLDRRVVDQICSMPERNRYFAGLRAHAGFRQVGIPVERGARYDSTPRVQLVQLLELASDAVVAFSTVPLRIITLSGVLAAIAGFGFGTLGLVLRLGFGVHVLGWQFGLSAMSFFGGLLLLFLGIVGEYVGRIYEEVKRRPLYVVSHTAGFPTEPDSPQR